MPTIRADTREMVRTHTIDGGQTVPLAFPVRVDARQGVRTARMTLRPLEQGDRAEFASVVTASRADVGRWIPFLSADESVDAFFQRQIEQAAEGDERRHAWRRVGVLDDGRIVGGFNLNAISRGLDWLADAVWWVATEHAGQGLATEGVRGMLAHAFAPLPGGLGLTAVHAGIEPANTASARVAEKCGMVRDARLRSHLKVGERWAVHDFYIARG